MEITKENICACEKVIEAISQCKLDMKNSCDVLRYVAKQVERTAAIDTNAVHGVIKELRKITEE